MSRLIADEPPVLQGRRGGRRSFFHGARLAPGQRLLAAGALEQRDFGSLIYLVEVFSIAPRLQMDVALVVRNGGRLDGIIARLLRQFLEGVIGFLAYQITLLQPSLGAAGGADPGKTAVASEYLHRLAVLYRSGLVVNRGHLVAQKGLRGGYVGHLFAAAFTAIAAVEQGHARQQDEKRTACEEWAAEFHGVKFSRSSNHGLLIPDYA